MTHLRIFLILTCLGLAALALVSLTSSPAKLRVVSASLHPMGTDRAMVTMTLFNEGPPVWLESVSTKLGQAHLTASPLPLPGAAEAGLEMSGAHVMLRGLKADQASRGVPLRLHLAGGATVDLLAEPGTGTMAMDHGAGGIDAAGLALDLSLDAQQRILTADVTNFTFSGAMVDGAHQPGMGHGHVYVDGVKIGRMLDRSLPLPSLPAGAYRIRVALFTNDHQPYLSNGQPVQASVPLRVSP